VAISDWSGEESEAIIGTATGYAQITEPQPGLVGFAAGAGQIVLRLLQFLARGHSVVEQILHALKCMLSQLLIGSRLGFVRLSLTKIGTVQFHQHIALDDRLTQVGDAAHHTSGDGRRHPGGAGLVVDQLAGDGLHQGALGQINHRLLDIAMFGRWRAESDLVLGNGGTLRFLVLILRMAGRNAGCKTCCGE
jgi:hypothetical protein